LNPVIKFTTLFGLLAVELAVEMTRTQGARFTHILAAVFFLVSVFFVYRSFYGMRIVQEHGGATTPVVGKMGADREGLA
jgi:K(+)-stimulated pyrophosphate-energized sodium pump